MADHGGASCILKESSVFHGTLGEPYLFPTIILMLSGIILLILFEHLAVQKPIKKDTKNLDG